MKKYFEKVLKTVMFIGVIFLINLIWIDNSYAEDLPKIVLTSYSVKSGNFEMGETTTLSLVFSNVGTIHAKNIVISYETEKSYIHSIFGSSNQIFIPLLYAGKSKAVDIQVEVSKLEELENLQSIPIYFEAKCYSYVTGTADVNEFAIYAPINSVKMQSEISVSSTTKKGAKTFISANVSNKGYKDIFDAKMFVLGNIDKSEENVGQIELSDKEKNAIGKNNYVVFPLEDILAGGTGYIENTLVFNKTGKQTILIFFSYKDKNGNVYIVKSGEQTVSVSKMNDSENESYVQEYDNIGKKKLLLMIGIIVIAVAIVVILVIRKKKK